MQQVETSSAPWPHRPWIMAAIGALTGLLIDHLGDQWLFYTTHADAIWRPAATAGVMVAGFAFLLTAERQRWWWSAGFALAWGTVIGLIGWYGAAYGYQHDLFEFPFFSGLLAVLIAAPLFQVVRDEQRLVLPYRPLHRYAWTDAIIGGASLAFIGLSFALAFMLAALFRPLGIHLLADLLQKSWFVWMLAGAAFGGASAVLRERDLLLGTLQRLVMVVFAVLGPVLAAALLVFLVALPLTGFAGLWRSGLPETPLLLSAAAFAFVFLNAIIGDSAEDRSSGRLWRWTALVLAVEMLPLGVLALVSMMMRVGQYGWTPARIWGVIASLVATGYGVAGWLAVARRRWDYDALLRPYQARLAVGLCGLALVLALPLIDFGAISARSQLARLESGRVTVGQFDWAAMAFDFGPTGRAALTRIAGQGPIDQRPLAVAALKSTNRWDAKQIADHQESLAGLGQRLRLVSPDIVLNDDVKRRISANGYCPRDARCALIRVSPDRLMLVSTRGRDSIATAQLISLKGNADECCGLAVEADPVASVKADPATARIELREVRRRQLFVDGKPVGQPVE